MRHARVLPIAGPTVLLAAGWGGEDRANGPEEAAAAGGTQAVAPERKVWASTGAASGGRVETCDGGSIRLSAAQKRLTEAARAHSEEMIEEDYFAHTAPGGEGLGERLKRFGYTPEGYRYWKVGGNIAWHSGPEPKPEDMFEGWMDSPGHRKNILDEDIRQIGIGTHSGEYEDSVPYTADFGVRRR